MKILFIDPRCTTPYDSQTLHSHALGGAQASTIQIARALSQSHYVLVAQQGRRRDLHENARLGYIRMEAACPDQYGHFDAVVVLRATRLVPTYRSLFPDSRLFLWLHNYIGPKLRLHRSKLRQSRCDVITVSKTHRDFTRQWIAGSTCENGEASDAARSNGLRVTYIYNPIDDALCPNDTPVDNNKLVFFSSPHKGLGQVLEAFRHARKRLPRIELCIANPGYYPLKFSGLIGTIAAITGGRWFPTRAQCNQEGVRILGNLPQQEILQHVREACCVFYPQRAFPETFGLVYAEANAVGTPVLAHDFGSAREILSSANQLVDASQTPNVVAKLSDWCHGRRPQVTGRNELRLSVIAPQWEELLAGQRITARTARATNIRTRPMCLVEQRSIA